MATITRLTRSHSEKMVVDPTTRPLLRSYSGGIKEDRQHRNPSFQLQLHSLLQNESYQGVKRELTHKLIDMVPVAFSNLRLELFLENEGEFLSAAIDSFEERCEQRNRKFETTARKLQKMASIFHLFGNDKIDTLKKWSNDLNRISQQLDRLVRTATNGWHADQKILIDRHTELKRRTASLQTSDIDSIKLTSFDLVHEIDLDKTDETFEEDRQSVVDFYKDCESILRINFEYTKRKVNQISRLRSKIEKVIGNISEIPNNISVTPPLKKQRRI